MSNNPSGIQAVIFDWAGTAVDHGCQGPVAAFMRAFEHFGLTPTVEETREPMGREKKEHIASMLAMPRLAAEWTRLKGHAPNAADIEDVFALLQKIMPEVLADHAMPVPGCADTMAELAKMKIKTGSCTGYSRGMMTRLIPVANANGFRPDCLVTADEVPAGRPLPWMCWKNCMELGVFPPHAVVKVGDTIADIREGINAGHWSVAVTRTSNGLGLTEAEAAADPDGVNLREKELAREFMKAGAHYVISSIQELPELCDVISSCIGAGRRPG